MSRKNNTITFTEEKKRPMINFFIVIIAIVLVSPFLIVPLRYQIGEAFSTLINGIGSYAIVIGGIFIAFGVVGIFTKRGFARYMIIGVVLLYIGAWCTGSVIDLFGISINGPNTTGAGNGYR